MEKGVARGMYVGLPTMATANAMFERMHATYRRLYSDDAAPSFVLAHSARGLSDLFQSLIQDASSASESGGRSRKPENDVGCWVADNRKKALLTHFGHSDGIVGFPKRWMVLNLFRFTPKKRRDRRTLPICWRRVLC